MKHFLALTPLSSRNGSVLRGSRFQELGSWLPLETTDARSQTMIGRGVCEWTGTSLWYAYLRAKADVKIGRVAEKAKHKLKDHQFPYCRKYRKHIFCVGISI